MSQGFSKVTVAGALAKDPEMRYTPSGQPVTSFSIPVSRRYETRGEQVNETIWHRIAVWGNAAEACNKYLKKGSVVIVEGRLVVDRKTGGPRIYERSDGSAGASFEINATSIQFLWTGPKNEDAGSEYTSSEQGEEEVQF